MNRVANARGGRPLPLLVLLATLVLVSTSLAAQSSEDSAEPPGGGDSAADRLNRVATGEVSLDEGGDAPSVSDSSSDGGADGAGGGGDLALPAPPSAMPESSPLAAKYHEAMVRYYDYRISGYDHREGLFRWQLFSSKTIFVIVLVLVCAGIYFAAVQFHVGLSRGGTGGEAEVTEIVASLKEIKVSSPILGVIILTLSLAFFYLYLVYVYPIENVF